MKTFSLPTLTRERKEKERQKKVRENQTKERTIHTPCFSQTKKEREVGEGVSFRLKLGEKSKPKKENNFFGLFYPCLALKTRKKEVAKGFFYYLFQVTTQVKRKGQVKRTTKKGKRPQKPT